MTERERLVEMLNKATDEHGICFDKIAGYMLASGVIVPTGNIGDTACVVDENSNEFDNIDKYHMCSIGGKGAHAYRAIQEVLDIINQQEIEIERLKQENKEYCETNRIITYQRNQRDKEIRALHNQLNGLNFMDKQIKSEAIKGFAERFSKALSEFDMSSVGLPDYDRGYKDCMTAIKDTIDNLVKEMTEEGHGRTKEWD